jgi:hypothetical protein
MAFQPADVIAAPEPGPLRYGIFNVATGPLSMPSRAGVAGVTYDPVGCGTARGYPAECDDTPPTKVFDPNVGEQETKPFVVYSSLVCGAAGYTPGYLASKVRRRLMAVEQHGVEEAVWSGAIGGVTLGNLPTFQGGGVQILTATAGLNTAIGLLEDYAGSVYGYEPVLHVEARLAQRLGAQGGVRQDGALKRTTMGTPIVFGSGYPGTSPAGVAAVANHAWIYITGRVTLWRADDIFIPQREAVMNKTTNQISLIAEREWMAAIDCFVAAIDVDLSTGV